MGDLFGDVHDVEEHSIQAGQQEGYRQDQAHGAVAWSHGNVFLSFSCHAGMAWFKALSKAGK